MDASKRTVQNVELDNKSSSEENNMNTGNVVKERLGKCCWMSCGRDTVIRDVGKITKC